MALWLKIMKKGFVAHGLDEVLSSYRVLSGSNTSNKLKAIPDKPSTINSSKFKELTSLSRSSIYRLMGKGVFPKSKGILGGNIVIWVRKEVEEWIKEQVETAVA